MSFALLGIGTAVPPMTIDQHVAAGIAAGICCQTPEHESWLPLMYQNTGIRTRHVRFEPAVVQDVIEGTQHSGSPFLPGACAGAAGPPTSLRMQAYGRDAAILAVSSSRQALQLAGVDAGTITHLVTISCTGFQAPGFDLAIIDQVRLRPNVARTHIGFMGCHGALNGLRVTHAFTAVDPNAVVLLCATELCSLHFHYGWDPAKMVANALFADGAAAVVASASGTPAHWRLVANGSQILPDSAQAMTWTVGDHGFQMSLTKEVPDLIRRHLRDWLAKWLSEAQCGMADIEHWAVHPGGPRILDAVEQALSLESDALADSRAVFAEYGNMSSPTVLFILDRLTRADVSGRCVALGFGPGLTIEAALLTRE